MCRKLGLLLEIGMAVMNEDGRCSRWQIQGSHACSPFSFACSRCSKNRGLSRIAWETVGGKRPPRRRMGPGSSGG